MYVSFPGCGILRSYKTVGAPGADVTTGTVYDLAVGGGKLFAPDFDGNQVRRLGLGANPTVETTVAMPTANSQPDGVAVVGDTLWVTEWGTGNLTRFSIGPTGGNAAELSTPASR